MTTYLITRHAGARAWAEQLGLQIDRLMQHLDPEQIQPGDTVIGTLPLHLIAAICDKPARYFNLVLDVPEALRGKELSAEDMTACQARIERYEVRRVAEEESAP
jgi:CRISPR-associated protein Csx16